MLSFFLQNVLSFFCATMLKVIIQYQTEKEHMKCLYLTTLFCRARFDSIVVVERNKISHFVKNMPAFDSKSLRTFIKDNEPGIDMSPQFTCHHCQHVNKANLAITPEFFWPRT